MTYFPDTCILIKSTCKHEQYFKKAHKLIIKNEDNWLISTIVYEEFYAIKERRIQFYKNILSLLRNLSKGISIKKDVLWSKYFKSTIKTPPKRTKNDEIHLKILFDHLLEKAGLSKKTTFNYDELKKICNISHPIIQNILVITGQINIKFKDPHFFKSHVVQKYYKDSICKRLRHDLYNLKNAHNNKEDLKIVMDATIHSENIIEKMIILTVDSYLLNQISDILMITEKKRPTSNIEIKHIKDYI